MSLTPEGGVGWANIMVHSVYDQPNAEAVHAQFDRVLDALAEKLRQVASHLDHAPGDILAFTALPQADLAPDLEQQAQRAAQPGDPPPHRHRGHLPDRDGADPPRGAHYSPNNTTSTPRCAATSASTSSRATEPATDPGEHTRELPLTPISA